jgi:hypothetical protein
MILRECDTCEGRTDFDRRQWAEADGGRPVIRTEYTCTECGTTQIDSTEIDFTEFETDGLPDRT